jgi:ABC-type glycerol-3-phosphate transport system substrate-binding protein
LGTKRSRIALLAGLAALVAAGCGSANTAATVIRVMPEEFFTGDLKRLEPHLEMTAACVNQVGIALDGTSAEATVAREKPQ